jgi:hypothetical protein
MTQIIWTLLLTVCLNDKCASQTIAWFDLKSECIAMKALHEDFPKDVNWQSVEYSCSIVNGAEA